MKTLDELKKEADKIRAQIYAIELWETKKANQALVGKCYRYRNTYGSDEGWWLYIRVTDAGERWPLSFRFQHTTSNKFEVEPDHIFMGGAGYHEITRDEFDAAWESFLLALARFVHIPTNAALIA